MADSELRVELVDAAIGGDVAALTALLTGLYGSLRQWLGQKIPAGLRGSIDADDIIQETHIAVFRRIAAFEARGPEAFDRWVRTIALHKLRKAIRHQRAAKRGGGGIAVQSPAHAALDESITLLLNLLEAPGRTPSASVARLEALEAMQAALETLPEDYRQAVRLVHLQALPVQAAAAEMGRTDRAVHNLCYKARERLRELLKSRSM